LCAIIGITNECKIMQVKTQQLYYVVEIRWMTTCFGLYTYFNWAIIRSTLVTKEEFYTMHIVLYSVKWT
jgi:hypothetical protein